MTNHTATCFAVLRATRKQYGSPHPDTGMMGVERVRIVRVVQSYPQNLDGDEVVVKLAVSVPGEAFDPLVPAATITVPASMIDRPVEVEAVPTEDGV